MKSTQLAALVRRTAAVATTNAAAAIYARRHTQYHAPLLPTEVATLERLGHSSCVYYSRWAGDNFDLAYYGVDGAEHDALLAELRDYPQTPSIARLLYVVSNAVAA